MFEKINKVIKIGAVAERFSYREKDGVEIYEHDAFCTRRSEGLADVLPRAFGEGEVAAAYPGGAVTRLVVDDENRNGRSIITRSRSDISGLNSLLGQVFRSKR